MRCNQVVWLVVVVCGLCVGCVAPASSADAVPATVRPVDRVRADLVAFVQQLDAIHATTQALANGSAASAATRRRQFSQELRAIEQLRPQTHADAVAFKERADEVLALWGPQSSTFRPSEGGLITMSNQPRERARAKYDEMVKELLAAQKDLDPMMTDLQQVEQQLSRLPAASQGEQATRALPRVQAVRSHLQTALLRLDELVALMQSPGRSPGGH